MNDKKKFFEFRPDDQTGPVVSFIVETPEQFDTLFDCGETKSGPASDLYHVKTVWLTPEDIEALSAKDKVPGPA
jgi:hypothetical protein